MQAAADANDSAVSSITAAELYQGAARSFDLVTGTRDVASFLASVNVFPVELAIAQHYAVLKAQLQAAGQVLANFDLLIAATALVHGHTLVTHNTRHFARIPDL